MSQIDSIDDATAYIHDRSGYDRGFISNPFAGDEAARLGLIRTAAVLDRLGNPQRTYPIVHVAGSKGKGSTCSFIDSILRAAGNRSGRFLSPHLHSFRERFVVNDEMIPVEPFTGMVSDVAGAIAAVESNRPEIGQVTAWELSTALALHWFARSGCDVAVIEVGLGGTLDATSVVEPAVSVITRLDFEHTSILGATMAEIAGNKAGIIKPGRPVVSVDQPPEGMDVIIQRATSCHSPLLIANRDWRATGTDRSFTVEGPGWRHERLSLSLAGQHQVENAALAVAAIHALAGASSRPGPVDENAIRSGLATTFVPGRFELVPVAGKTVVIDGAHTPASANALARAVRDRFADIAATMVIGMLGDKDPDQVLPAFDDIANHWIVTPLKSPRSQPVAALAESLGRRDIDSFQSASVAEAIAQALTMTGPGGLVIVTGSLTTVAEARVALGLAAGE